MTMRMDAPTAGSLVGRLRSSAAAARDAEGAAVAAFDELLRRAQPFPALHAALSQFWSARVGAATAICGHLGQVADALDTATTELEHDDTLVTRMLQ